MKHIKQLSISFTGLAAAMLAMQASAQTVLTASSWLPPTHTLSMAQKEWCDLLEKNTSGKMKCNILPRGVSAPPGTYAAVKNGLADISFTVHGYTPGRFVMTQMAEFDVVIAQKTTNLRLALADVIEDASNELGGLARLARLALQRAQQHWAQLDDHMKLDS